MGEFDNYPFQVDCGFWTTGGLILCFMDKNMDTDTVSCPGVLCCVHMSETRHDTTRHLSKVLLLHRLWFCHMPLFNVQWCANCEVATWGPASSTDMIHAVSSGYYA